MESADSSAIVPVWARMGAEEREIVLLVSSEAWLVSTRRQHHGRVGLEVVGEERWPFSTRGTGKVLGGKRTIAKKGEEGGKGKSEKGKSGCDGVIWAVKASSGEGEDGKRCDPAKSGMEP